jgi:cytochrome c-type biogenesis protein CcmH/NrfG
MALKEYPANAQLWALQGLAFASKGENKNALAAFQHSLKISPSYITVLTGARNIALYMDFANIALAHNRSRQAST